MAEMESNKFLDCVRNHTTTTYAMVSTASTRQMAKFFEDLEFPCEQQMEEVIRTTRAAEQAWTSAVEHLAAKRDVLAQKLVDARKELAKIRAQLGDGGDGDSPNSGDEQAESMTSALTLKGTYDQVHQVLLEWQGKKAARLSKFEAHQVQNQVLRQQLGLPPCTAKADISKAGLDLMEMERQRLSAEKDRRLSCLYSELARLEMVCEELGEDARAAAADVHPSYRNLRSSSVSAADAQTVDDLLGNIDLSEAAFARMTAKIKEMQAIKEQRVSQLQQLQDVLYSAWDAMGCTEYTAERAALAPLLDGPERLHASTKHMAFAEVRRLEECESAKMKDLALSKARELQSACIATRIPVPSLEDMLADASKRGVEPSEVHPGQISECLARLVRSLAEVTVMAERRRVLVDAVSRVEHIRAESDWLREFEADENRYKGRDASARLNRSLKAQKLRESIPEATEALKVQLEEWAAVEGAPFLYDGQDYMEALLDLQDAYQAEQAERAAALRARHQSRDAKGGTPQKAHPASPAKSMARPPSAKPQPHTPSGRSTPAGQQALLGRAATMAQNGAHASPGTALLSTRPSQSGALSSRSTHAQPTGRSGTAPATPPPPGFSSATNTPSRRTSYSDLGDRHTSDDGKVDAMWGKSAERDADGCDASRKRGKDQNQGLFSPSPVKAASRIPRPGLASQ